MSANIPTIDSEGKTPLDRAVLQGDIETIKSLLANGATEVHSRFTHKTPLHYAMERDASTPQKVQQTLEIVVLLIAAGVDVHRTDEMGRTALHYACETPGTATIRNYLIANGANVNAPDREGNTPLHRIIQTGGSDNAIKHLIQKGADICVQNNKGEMPITSPRVRAHINVADENGNTALHRAAIKNDKDAIHILHRNRANPQTKNLNGQMPVHCALLRQEEKTNRELVEILVDHNFMSLSARDNQNNTPLHYAIKNGDKETIAFLLQKGADICIPNSNGDTPLALLALKGEPYFSLVRPYINRGDAVESTPLHRAAIHRNIPAIQILLENGANISAINSDGEAPLSWLMHEPYLSLVTPFINTPDANGDTPLHRAVIEGNINLIQLVLASGAKIDTKNNKGQTPLHYACIPYPRPGLLNNPKIIEMLITAHADVKAVDNESKTPLHYACADVNISGIRSCLIRHGASPNAQDQWGNTPLHVAVRRGDLNAVSSLLRKGADLNIINHEGKTALHLAIEKFHTQADKVEEMKQSDIKIVELLAKRVSGDPRAFPATLVHFVIIRGLNDELLPELLLKGADVNARDNQGNTPLHHAVRKGDMKAIQSLLQAGADVNATNEKGETPLHVVYQTKPEQMHDIIACLLRNESDVDAQDNEGNTPLHLLTRRNVHNTIPNVVFELLFDSGAKVNAKNHQGQTPLHLISMEGFGFDGNEPMHSFLRLFLRNGANPSLQDSLGNTPADVYSYRTHHQQVLRAFFSEDPLSQVNEVRRIWNKSTATFFMSTEKTPEVSPSKRSENNLAGVKFDAYLQWPPEEVRDNILSLVAADENIKPRR